MAIDIHKGMNEYLKSVKRPKEVNIKKVEKLSMKRFSKVEKSVESAARKTMTFKPIIKKSKTVYAVQARKPAEYKRIFFKS